MADVTSPRDDAPHPEPGDRTTAAALETPERERGEAAATLTRPDQPDNGGRETR